MDTICGVGLPELILLALLSFVLVGPERSQDVALKAGRFLSTVIRSKWWKEFNDVTGALRNLPQTLVRMAEIEDAQSDLRDTVGEINRGMRFDIPPKTQAPTAQPDTISVDPWGIENAVAQTTHTPSSEAKEETDSLAPDELGEDSPKDSESTHD